jgi:molybdate transport system substrate-binding protein
VRTRSLTLLAAAVAATAFVAGCSSGEPAPEPFSSASTPALTGKITVFAAASLKESFTQIGKLFEQNNPGTSVTFVFGPSSGLATQLVQGADADVFASASPATMKTVTDAGLSEAPQPFATNTMAIATPKGSSSVSSLAGLAAPGIKVAVCQAQVPCGVSAQKLFEKNSLSVTPVTEEVDVKAVLTKVELGEVDAGVVYLTDVKTAGDKVRPVLIAPDHNVTTTYPIAVLKASRNQATAAAFEQLVITLPGQQVLRAAGFTSP